MKSDTMLVLIALLGQSGIMVGLIWKMSKWTTTVDLTLKDYTEHKSNDKMLHENIRQDIEEINLQLAQHMRRNIK
jgi:uncharacterized OsmC-like protein